MVFAIDSIRHRWSTIPPSSSLPLLGWQFILSILSNLSMQCSWLLGRETKRQKKTTIHSYSLEIYSREKGYAVGMLHHPLDINPQEYKINMM